MNGQSVIEGGNNWGLVCGGLSAVLYAVMVICNKQSKNIIGMENSVIQLTVSFLIPISAGEIPWILFLGLINTGLGCYLYFSPLNNLPVQTVAVCGYLEPLSAVVFSAIILGERMTYLQMTGAVCIIGGAMLGEEYQAEARK